MQNNIEKIKELMGFTRTLNVLYIEDNEEARRQTLKMLKNFFANIEVGIDGVDGLEKFKSYHDTTGLYYDLVISDINMPNMDGITMGKHIVQLHAKQQIIIISAFNDTKNLEDSTTAGIKHYIHKPIELNALIDVIGQTTEAIKESTLIEA